eukprot:3135272-Alexandrium_andersonii.AAC.1
MRTCTWRSLRKCPSRGCAPSSGAASTALVPPRPVGGRFTQKPSRVSGSPGARPALVASTTRDWM